MMQLINYLNQIYTILTRTAKYHLTGIRGAYRLIFL